MMKNLRRTAPVWAVITVLFGLLVHDAPLVRDAQNYLQKHLEDVRRTYDTSKQITRPLDRSGFHQDFRHAKVLLHTRIFNTPALMVDLYCNCTYGRDRVMDWSVCGYRPRANAERGKRLEWEHVVPASFFGQGLACWKDGGRKNCTRTDRGFNDFEGDLHNLRPSVGELNADRSNLPYGDVAIKKQRYGSCQFYVDGGLVEPPDSAKGHVARVWLYMAQKYKFTIPPSIAATIQSWHERFPVTDHEREINRRIKAVQGDTNPWIEN